MILTTGVETTANMFHVLMARFFVGPVFFHDKLNSQDGNSRSLSVVFSPTRAVGAAELLMLLNL